MQFTRARLHKQSTRQTDPPSLQTRVGGSFLHQNRPSDPTLAVNASRWGRLLHNDVAYDIFKSTPCLFLCDRDLTVCLFISCLHFLLLTESSIVVFSFLLHMTKMRNMFRHDGIFNHRQYSTDPGESYSWLAFMLQTNSVYTIRFRDAGDMFRHFVSTLRKC